MQGMNAHLPVRTGEKMVRWVVNPREEQAWTPTANSCWRTLGRFRRACDGVGNTLKVLFTDTVVCRGASHESGTFFYSTRACSFLSSMIFTARTTPSSARIISPSSSARRRTPPSVTALWIARPSISAVSLF